MEERKSRGGEGNKTASQWAAIRILGYTILAAEAGEMACKNVCQSQQRHAPDFMDGPAIHGRRGRLH
jgi:hypothetical protein